MKNFAIIVILTALCCSCGDNALQLKPNVTGKTGEVIVVLDKAYWESGVGEALRATIGAEYPALPQEESLFTLLNVAPISFTRIFRVHRNVVTFEISPEHTEAKMAIRRDAWAAPQIVLDFTAPDTASLKNCILENGERMVHALEQTERDRIMKSAMRYEDGIIRTQLSDVFGGAPYIPGGYKVRKLTDDFAWVHYERTVKKKYMFQVVFMYKYPYKDSTSFSLDSILEKRNEILQREVPGMLEDSYMTTSMAIPPLIRSIRYKDADFTEVRGLWDVENDFQGGPFISHTFFDKTGKNLICVEAVVYAPGFDKRDYMRQTEGIIYSFAWKDSTLPEGQEE